MSVSTLREGWLQLFTQMRRPNRFLSRMFTMKPGAAYNGDKVSIDIERYGEDVAVAVKKFTGGNINDFDQFTTKEFTPPMYSEEVPLDVSDLINRVAGSNPFDAATQEYSGALISKIAKGMALCYDKILRAVELQASQILQTGKLTLKNSSDVLVYELDFAPKTAHFPTVGTAWSSTSSDKLGDIATVADLVRGNGQIDPNMLVMGRNALRYFLQDDKVQKQLDNQRYEVGQIAPRFANSGATFYGFVWIENYRFEIWSTPETYKHPQSGTVTRYLGDDKVIVLSNQTRLDMVSAAVPLPLGPDPRVASLLPGRLVSNADGFDVTPNVYCTPNGKQIIGTVDSRPLLVPVQIDGFGCITTTT